jgi:hypothetical protein
VTVYPENDDLRARVVSLEERIGLIEDAANATALGARRQSYPYARSVRRRSKTEVFGLPLWEIALGPDVLRGEMRGHAKAIFALGDIATGVFALGGLARGLFALGGVALGGVTLGGLSLGLLVALGGCAMGFGFSAGGLAVGTVAVGGAALGIVAVGGLAVGIHRIGPPLI